MDLSLSHIEFSDFRNYESFSLEDVGPLSVFVGPNAAGKTSIVEGIQLLSSHASFRTSLTQHLVRFGRPFARLEGLVEGGKRKLLISLQIQEGKKRFFLNGKPKRPVDMKGLLPSVVFTPDDLALAKGSLSLRRAALDSLGSQLSANHYVIRRDYEKVLRHKTRLLKDEAPDDLLQSINEMVVTCGAQLSCYRAALFEKLRKRMSELYQDISSGGEILEGCFVPSWLPHDPLKAESFSFGRDEARSALRSALSICEREERARRRALVGPHADRIEFYIDGRNVSSFGSQGQQRSVVLAFKLAELSLVQEVLHQKPILLLDDVMSELDASRRRALVSFISDDIQTLVTTTNLSYFDSDLLSSAQVVELPIKKEGPLKKRSTEQGEL